MDTLDMPNSLAAETACDLFTSHEIEAFRKNGFLVCRNLVSRQMLDIMRQVTQWGLERTVPPIEYEADLKYPGAPGSLDDEGGSTIRRLKQAHSRHIVFSDFVTSKTILGRLQQLLGGRVVMPLAHHNCIMTKQPRYSSDTNWHQDIRYWSFQSPDLINVWLALGNENERNGCLHVLPGTHTSTPERNRLDEALFLRPDLAENRPMIETRIPVILEAGDVLFFHCRTFHAATKNYTDESKYSVVFTFRSIENLPIPGTRSDGLELLLPAI